MSRLSNISGQQCIRALEKAGFVVKRQKGSHVRMTRQTPYRQVTVPDHKELKAGTLRAIIRQAGLTVDEFLELLS